MEINNLDYDNLYYRSSYNDKYKFNDYGTLDRQSLNKVVKRKK